MTNLLRSPNGKTGKVHDITAASAGWGYVGFGLYHLKPGETAEERTQTYDLIEEVQPDVVQIHIFNVFPGAPAMELYPHLFNPKTTKFTGAEGDEQVALDAERRRFYRRYYLHPRYLGRTLKRRWRPMLANLEGELDFVRRASRFFLRERRPSIHDWGLGGRARKSEVEALAERSLSAPGEKVGVHRKYKQMGD